MFIKLTDHKLFLTTQDHRHSYPQPDNTPAAFPKSLHQTEPERSSTRPFLHTTKTYQQSFIKSSSFIDVMTQKIYTFVDAAAPHVSVSCYLAYGDPQPRQSVSLSLAGKFLEVKIPHMETGFRASEPHCSCGRVLAAAGISIPSSRPRTHTWTPALKSLKIIIKIIKIW